jgi:methyl coenzyme M reductase alpha subunit
MKLQNEGLINSAKPLHGGNTLLVVYIDNVNMTKEGLDYVESKLQIDKTLSNLEKVQKVAETASKWGLEQVKDIASKTLAELVGKAIGIG